MLEQRPALSNGDQIFEHYSQGNLNDLTFQYSNPNGSEDAFMPFGSLSQSHSQVINSNASMDSSTNANGANALQAKKQMVSDDNRGNHIRMNDLEAQEKNLQQSSSTQQVAHSSRGINMNIEQYQARRKVRNSKYQSLIGSTEPSSTQLYHETSAAALVHQNEVLNDRRTKTDRSMKTGESTPTALKAKATAQRPTEQQRRDFGGGGNASETKNAQLFTQMNDQKADSKLVASSSDTKGFAQPAATARNLKPDGGLQ